jgi:hypothetical protein
MTALARRLRATGIAAGRSADVPCVRDDRERQWGGDRKEAGNACHGGFELSVPRCEWASKRADGISANPLICSWSDSPLGDGFETVPDSAPE